MAMLQWDLPHPPCSVKNQSGGISSTPFRLHSCSGPIQQQEHALRVWGGQTKGQSLSTEWSAVSS